MATASDSQQRKSWQRSTSLSDDVLTNDLRPNNWDFSQRKANTSFDGTKRRKKGNPEREREQSLGHETQTPPHSDKKRTPTSYPRTKITPSTPTAERVALENLKQHMTFSDVDDINTDEERNNERNIPSRRDRPSNYTHQEITGADGLRRHPHAQGLSADWHANRNNNRDDGYRDERVDGSHIVGRLMQIREYIKQAHTMMDTLKKSGDQRANKEEIDKLKTLTDNLREQERGYLGLLQRILASREDSSLEHELAQLTNIRIDPFRTEEPDETTSVDLEMVSEASDANTEGTKSSSSRPRIEDKLGMDSDAESADDFYDMDDTVINRCGTRALEFDYEIPSSQLEGAVAVDHSEEIAALKQQEELLKKLVRQQEQLRALQGRQTSLLALQKEAENKMAEEKARNAIEVNNRSGLIDVIPKSSSRNRMINDDEEDMDQMPRDLLEITQRLNNLKTEVGSQQNMENRHNNTESEASSTTQEKQHLQYKLLDLQDKKHRMDDLLKELEGLRSQRYDQLLNNGPVSEPTAVDQGTPSQDLMDPTVILANADETAGMAEGVIEVLDAREKLKKLTEVKERLDQLRSLVQYYQTANRESGRPQDNRDQMLWNDKNLDLLMTNNRASAPVQESVIATAKTQNIPVTEDQQSEEENASISESESDENKSQLSSMERYDDDPNLQDKKNKLRDAKEKLKELQNLLSNMQSSASHIPNEVAEILALRQRIAQSPAANAVVNDGEGLPKSASERDFFEAKLKDQMSELKKLKVEKDRLMALQDDLVRLNKLKAEQEKKAAEDRNNTEVKCTQQESLSEDQENVQPQSTHCVTFSSNDEIYDSMRKQRIIREELRQKKKELEAIMKKDRNKRQYSRNQDNQSDTVSYSTEALGAAASVDATMATWGGSTVDNLESITEDEDRDEDDDSEEDDGYPIDGIVQVEEEEEANASQRKNYSLEDDARQRQKARKSRQTSSLNRRKQTFPRSLRDQDKQKQSNVSNSKDYGGAKPKGTKNSRLKQENYRSAEQIVQEDEQNESLSPGQNDRYESLQRQLQRTSSLLQNLLQDQQHLHSAYQQPGVSISPNVSFRSNPVPDLYQQQLLMNMNQCYQQLIFQQSEISNLQQQVRQLNDHPSYRHNDSVGALNNAGFQVMSSTPQETLATQRVNPANLRGDFSLSPRFPPNFTYAGRNAHQESADQRDKDNKTKDKSQLNMANRKSNVNSVPNVLNNNSHLVSASQPLDHQQQSTATYATSSAAAIKEVQHANRLDPSMNIEDYVSRRRRQLTHRKVNKSTSPYDQSEDYGRYSLQQSNIQENLHNTAAATATWDQVSISSALSSVPGPETNDQNDPGNSDDPSGLGLFEALRQTIYTEVANLISQNETRPYFLIKMFRALQLISTDYLRTRCLASMNQLVSDYLRSSDVPSNTAGKRQQAWLPPHSSNIYAASELTPSESIVTSDEEESRRSFTYARINRDLHSHPPRKNQYDYVERVDNLSSVSTASLGEIPFAQDSLGDTAINLEQALQRMKEFEQHIVNAEQQIIATSTSPDLNNPPIVNAPNLLDPNSSSAVDQGSESSMSDAPYPQINTQQLNQQIKAIMQELIPVLKDHMDEVCSQGLLSYLKTIILSFTRKLGNGQEYTSFFQRQLGPILQKSLSRYEGRKLRECGEDLSVDMSELLFNELAFFRLLQDLNDPNLAEQMRVKSYKKLASQGLSESSKQQSKMYTLEVESSSTVTDVSDNTDDSETEEHVTRAMRLTGSEEEELGKRRDDDFANIVSIQDSEDKDEDGEGPNKTSSSLKIRLAVSETKPFTRIGSDEDDEDADESQSADDLSETAVSRDAKLDGTDIADNNVKETETDASQSLEQVASSVDTTKCESSSICSINEKDTEEANEKQVIAINGINGESAANEDFEEVTLDDIPLSLNINNSKEYDEKLEEEQKQCSGPEVVLAAMSNQTELAGDGEAVNMENFTENGPYQDNSE